LWGKGQQKASAALRQAISQQPVLRMADFSRLVEVFDRLRIQSLKLEPDKCEFIKKEVYFFEYKLTADGVAMGERYQV
jgi:hypothetical protein